MIQLRRRLTFFENVERVKQHNAKTVGAHSSYTLGINKFTDMTHEEFVKVYTGAQVPPRATKMLAKSIAKSSREKRSLTTASLPSSFDWRDTPGYVTSVKDQAYCGCCWAFSAVAALEAQWFKKFSLSHNLSAQNALDCTYTSSYNGCNGGWMEPAFILMINGIMDHASYPVSSQIFLCP
jgi:C1A family cysteine protease